VQSEFAASEMLSGEEYTAKINVVSFGLVLFQIVVGRPALRRTDESDEGAEIAGFVPQVVFSPIESGLSANPQKIP
jgi:hypothetical protein